MRFPIKEGTGLPYGVPAGTKVAKDGNVIGIPPKIEEPKKEENKPEEKPKK